MENVEDTQKAVEVTYKNIAEYASYFTGTKEDGEPKGYLTYMSYDNGVPEDDPSKSEGHILEGATLSLSVDPLTGFYLLDVNFTSADNTSLKTFWARLQEFRQRQMEEPEKLWIFYIELLENFEEDDEVIYTVRIVNPLAYYLIRSVPNEGVPNEFEVENGIFSGGNTVRLLLSREFVEFAYETGDGEDYSYESEEDQESEEDVEFSNFDLIRNLQG